MEEDPEAKREGLHGGLDVRPSGKLRQHFWDIAGAVWSEWLGRGERAGCGGEATRVGDWGGWSRVVVWGLGLGGLVVSTFYLNRSH